MRYFVCLLGSLLLACTSMSYPVTSGSHAAVREPGNQYVIWSNHQGVAQYIAGLVLTSGQIVVERGRLQQLFDEQRIRLNHTADDEAGVLRVGRLAGASWVIFADVQGIQPDYRRAFDPASALSVAVRCVSVESGAVQWVGTALYPDPMTVPDQAVIALTYWAIAHADCHGTWTEPSRTQPGGCVTSSLSNRGSTSDRATHEWFQRKELWR